MVEINEKTTQQTSQLEQKTNTNTLIPEEELRPKNGNIKTHLLKVYQTDEENFKPYRSGEKNIENPDTESSEDMEETNEDKNDSENFKLHQGEITKTYLYNQLFEASFNKDYENPTGQGKIKLKYQEEDLKKLYKGQRLELKTGREKENKLTKEEIDTLINAREKELEKEYIEKRKRIIKQHQEADIKNKENNATLYIVNNKDNEESIKEKENLNKIGVEEINLTEDIKKSIHKQAENEIIGEIFGIEVSILGWIMEETLSGDGIDISINDYGKLLENEDKLTYENMYRSQILEEVIKTAGLEPVVDFTDLQDDVISWTSVSNNGNSEDGDDAGSESTIFSDCSPILDMTNKLKCKVGGYGQIPSNITEDMYARIGKSSANYAAGMKGKSAREVWRTVKNGLKYCKYECNRDKCASTSWNNRSSPGLNCGDSARLLKCCMDVAGVPCIMIHTPGHFYNAVRVDGKWLTADLCYVNNRRGTNQLLA